MAVRLLLAPAACGMTSACIDRVRDVLATTPLADGWVLVPNRTQVNAFRRRLAERGGALGVRTGRFGDLYAAVLARAGRQLPEAPAPVIHRLVLAAIDAVADRGRLEHYAPIRGRRGAMSTSCWQIVEFKTDSLSDASKMDDESRKGYEPQVRRYVAAVHTLLGVNPQARICWLDLAGTVCWSPVVT